MNRNFIFFLILFVSLIGCEDKKESSSKEKTTPSIELTPAEPKLLFHDPAKPYLFELPSEALQVWRQTKHLKPALILFSNNPFLITVRDDRKADIADLIKSGDAESFKQRGSFYRVNPALIPAQTLSAAIDNDLFSEIIWVTPSQVSLDNISIEPFRQKIVDAGFMTEDEGKKLSHSDGITSGTVRGVPFRAVHPEALPDLESPVVIHFDTGYFKGLYRNEISTPPYDLLHQTASDIMQAEWQAYSVSLSYSTIEMKYSPDVRFLITALARIIKEPHLLSKMPAAWKLHADAIYADNMFMSSMSQDLIIEAVTEAPEDPTIIYALSLVRFKQNRAEEAFTLLDKAVQLDHGYGVTYLQLADKGRESGQLAKALELQRKAAVLYPENPFIKISEADILGQMGRKEEAVQLLNDLQTLPWSSYLHSGLVEKLNKVVESIRKPQTEKPAEIPEGNVKRSD